MYGPGPHGHMGPVGPNGNGPANGISRATPPTTPSSGPNAGGGAATGTTTTGGRRGRKRNTQIKEEF